MIPEQIDPTGNEIRIPLTIEFKQGAAAIPDDGSPVSSVCASKADALAAIQRLVELVQLSQFCGENPHIVAEIIHAGLPVNDDDAILIVDSIRATLIERAGE